MRPAFSLGEAAAKPPYASLAQAILAGVETFPDGRFLYFGPNGQACERSFGETLAQALRLLAGLRQQGMQAGDALLIGLTDARQTVPSLWASVLGGFVTVPFLHSTRPGTNGVPDEQDLDFLRETFSGLRVLVDKAGAAANTDADTDRIILDFDERSSVPAPRDVTPASGGGEDLRFAIMTSGTTARPRLVGLSDSAALARWWPQLPDAAHSRGFLSWSSFGHVMGLGLVMPNLPVKAHLDAARFVASPLSWLDALESAGATHATMTNFGMSLILQAMAENPGRQWRLGHVRKIGIGAEAISRKTCERFLKCLAEFGLREDALILGYGLSECGPVVGGGIPFSPFSAQSSDDAGIPPELDRPTRGHAVRIVGDSGYLLREGEVGRIEVRGPTMTSGYPGDDEATAALFTPDQWLRTGDLGVLRDGKLTVVGREKELIIVNAKKYTCQAIETAIRDRTGYQEVYVAPFEDTAQTPIGAPCAVFVVADRSGGRSEALESHAVAEAVRAATAQAFRFAPRSVVLVSNDDIPRTSLGKVRRLALPALLADPAIAGRVSHLAGRGAAVLASAGHTQIEARIARIWRELLRSAGDIDRDTDFYTLGGDSLLALRMSFLVEDELGVPVRLEQIQAKLSIAELARSLIECGIECGIESGIGSGSGASADAETETAPTVSLSGLPDWLTDRLLGFLKNWPGAPALPEGLVRRVGAGQQGIPVFWCMQDAEEALDFKRTVGGRFPSYAMRSGMWLFDYGTPLADALIDRYAEEITEICREGPVVIGGTCQGFNIALAIVRRLVAAGRDVRLLAAANCRFAELCGGSPVPVPLALFSSVGSKFNPYRYFRHPEIGLRKLAPQGLRLEMIDTVHADHARIMIGPAMDHLARGLETAIDWAQSQNPRHGTAAVPSPAAMYQRHIASPSKALDMRAGEHRGIVVELKNSSPVAWDAFDSSGLMLANHWLSGNGEMVIWSDGRTPLKRRLEPGELADMTLDIVAPHEPGSYLLEVDLVEEGICWFADFASSPLQIPVDVRSQDEGNS